MERKVEECLIEENEFMRIFKTKNVFCASSYFSKTFEKNVPVTITFHERKKDITLATCDNVFEADQVMQKSSVWKLFLCWRVVNPIKYGKAMARI